jgi:Ca-activated chloride channel family protein
MLEYVVPKENLSKEKAVFSLVVDITDDLPIRAVEVVGIEAEVQRVSKRHVRVLFEGEDVAFDDDVRIRYVLDSEDYGLRFMAHRNTTEEGTFMLLVTPKESAGTEEVIGRDIVFVIDISGSMSGEPLEQTKWALVHILDQLNPDDRFEVFSFDDNQYPLLGGLKAASASWRQQAQAKVSELASQGGTNILGAMGRALDILAADPGGDRPRAIIFLTDGQGMNPASSIIAEVRTRDPDVRVYSFGVGNGVNRPFLERIARENRGIATLVSHPDHLEREMRRLYDRISTPLMVDLDVRFEGLQVESTYPTRLPDLYQDGEVVLFGRYKRGGRGTVVVTGRLRGEETRLELPVVLPQVEEKHSYIEKLWARKRIDHLMDTLRDSGDSEALVQEVTRLGIVYNLVTEYTTFLAVPESLKTGEIKEMIRKGTKGYDKKLIDSIEGIKLSMEHIPPGDPVLTVQAPADALKVVAYFPFGLVKRMKWDEVRSEWNVRFLVPRDVADGLYEIRVLIVHGDGRLEWRVVEYYIDGTAPEFEAMLVATAAAGEKVRIEIDPYETVAEVFYTLPGIDETRVELTLDGETGRYVGDVQLPARFPEGPVTVRVVVRDKARNRFEQDFEVWEAEDLEEDLPEPPPGC